MSASLGPNSPLRIKDDAYITPAWAVWAVMPVVQEILHGLGSPVVWDAGCGDGAISKVVAAQMPHVRVHGIDVRPMQESYTQAVPGAQFMQRNFLDLEEDIAAPNMVIMNPPYKLAVEFVQHAIAIGVPYVVALLRLNFLAGQKRAPWMRDYCPHVAVLPRRPGFMPDKPGRTDGAEYAWMCWGWSRGTWEILHVRPADRHIARQRTA